MFHFTPFNRIRRGLSDRDYLFLLLFTCSIVLLFRIRIATDHPTNVPIINRISCLK
jgi:hypothetical protein